MLQGTQYCLKKICAHEATFRQSVRAFYPVMSLLICFKYCLQGTKHMTSFTVYEIYGSALNQKYKHSFLGLHQRVESLFPRSYMPIKIQTKEIMLLRGKKKRYSLLGKLKSASYQNVSLEKIMHGFYWPPIYLIPVSYFLMPLTHSLEQCIQQATL